MTPKHPLPLLLALSVALAAGPATGATQIGQTVFSKGATTAQGLDGAVRVVGKDSPIYEGDVLTTGQKSFAVVTLDDGTRMALRPDTVFKFEDYAKEEGRESAVMRLFKGGLRTVTGFISKRNPSAYKVQTAVATIGIRGTEFDARLCDADCRAEQEKLAGVEAKTSKVVGRVAFVKGDLNGTRGADPTRRMVLGAPLYAGDTLETGNGAFAVLAFRDESRITLSGNSSFRIESHQYDQAAPERSAALFRLLKGGLRAATGLIAKAAPQAYQVATPVATIGIRGTGFDVLCKGTCASGASSALPDRAFAPVLAFFRMLIPDVYAQALPANGMFVSVWDGSVTVGDQVVQTNQTLFFQSQTLPPITVPQPPPMPEPRPDTVPVDQQKLFGTTDKSDLPPGLYVAVEDGHATVTPGPEGEPGQEEKAVDLGGGEASFVGGEGVEAERLDQIPPVLSEDPAFKFASPDTQPLLELFEDSEGCRM